MHRTNSPTEVLEFARQHEVRMVDLRFCDWSGTWQHFTLPMHRVGEVQLHEGIRLPWEVLPQIGREEDAQSSNSIQFRVDCTSTRLDPFMHEPTLVLLGELCDSNTGKALPECARSIARRAVAYMEEEGIADRCSVGLEADFFVFDDVRFCNQVNRASYRVDSSVGGWNSDREEFPNLGYKQRSHYGIQVADRPLPPCDVHHDLRGTMVSVLEDLDVSVHHHQAGTSGAGQSSIGLARANLLEQADVLFWLKHVVKNVARRAGLVATFMPCPIAGSRGNRLRWMMSLWQSNRALFFGDGPEGLANTALHFAAGVVEHAAALSAFTRSSTNSYRRPASFFDSSSIGADGQNGGQRWSQKRDRTVICSSMIAHPEEAYLESPNSDAAGNAYLMFAAWLLAGLDGVKRQLAGKDASESASSNSLRDISMRSEASSPQDLRSALNALEKDHVFLVEGGVFELKSLLAWLSRRREQELDFIAQQPHPGEFELYFRV